jgi:hypothetical protein
VSAAGTIWVSPAKRDERALLEQALQRHAFAAGGGLEPAVVELAADGGQKQSCGDVIEAAVAWTDAM